MKLIGIASMFIAATVLVGSSSSTRLPISALSINIHAFVHEQLNNHEDKTAVTKIVAEAEKRLKTLFEGGTETTFELRFDAATVYTCGSLVDCHSSTIEGYDTSRTDLYVFFETGSASSGHSQLEGKMCHLQKDYRTVILPGRATEKSTRDLVYFIGRLLGMRYDDFGRESKYGNADCPLGNMVLDKNIKKNDVKQAWNKCNKEDLEDFYEMQMANEPRGFCLDKDVTIPKIDIYIHSFYDTLFGTESQDETEAKIVEVISTTETILNEGNTLGVTFELKLDDQDRLTKTPSDFDAMKNISNNEGASYANFYVFFTYKEQMPQAHPKLAGKICSNDRAHRTVSLTGQGFDRIGVARQLAYYIGLTLGMDYDGLHEYYKPDLKCQSGNMDFFHKNKKNSWDAVYAYFNSKKQWSQCNAEDLSSFYRQFLRSNNPGTERRRLCVTAPMTITIDAMHTEAFSKLVPGKVDAAIKEVVNEATKTLNQDSTFGIIFRLEMKSSSSLIKLSSEPTIWLKEWGSTIAERRPKADLYLAFDHGNDPSAKIAQTDNHLCTNEKEDKFVILRKNNRYTSRALGNQLAYYIGQLLGIKRNKPALTGRDNECRKGLMGITPGKTVEEKEKAWGGRQSWNSCNVEDMWVSYFKILSSKGSVCLQN